MTETVHANGWMLCLAFDISNLGADDRSIREARDLAIRASHTDELTGVNNRRYVMERIQDLNKTVKPSKTVVGTALAVLDLDNFKAINDCLGHNAGDEVLRDFVRHCALDFRLTDCLAA